ncbi:MAG: alpha/beta hydrolase [Caldilineaceae bacterium]|nr:alpha/beta hydrolase [Caldilineaceae bacterium]MCB0122933.1 alpha/beta hydrolase [Caldilineaceae bacterium]
MNRLQFELERGRTVNRREPLPTNALLRPRAALTRAVLLLCLLGCVAGLPAAFITPTTPAPAFLQNWAFDVRLLAGLPTKSLLSVLNGPLAAKTVYWDQGGTPVTFTSDGLAIVGTLVEPPGHAASYPGIVLLHGSTPVGRKMGLYRLLGHTLAERGYVVLTIDLRGYGASADPPDLQEPESFNFVADVRHAVDYLAATAAVRPDQIYLVGHSFGGDVAISAAVADPRVQKVVAIGPGRRFDERGGSPAAAEFNYFRRREMRYMLLRQAIPPATFMAYRPGLPLENHMDYFTANHQPLLLIDGALESPADQAFLADLYQEISEPKAYLTLAGADHYVNTANVGPLVIYDQRALAELVEEIDQWLDPS